MYDRELHQPVEDARVSKPILLCLDSERAHYCSYCAYCHVYHPIHASALLADLLTERSKAVLPNHRVILVEGIHLLSNEGGWAKAHHLFDRHIMLEVIKWRRHSI